MIIYAGSVGSFGKASKGSLSGHGEGVSVLEWNGEQFKRLDTAKADNTSTICLSKDGKMLYAANETKNFGGMNGSGGGITSFQIQSGGRLKKINDSISYGSRPAYVTVSESGRYLLAANHGSHTTVTCHYVQDEQGRWKLQRGFDDSSIAIFHLQEDGSIGELSDLKIFRGHGYWCHGGGQSTSHLHCVIIRNDIVIACNRGADEIEVLRLDEERGKLILLNQYHTRPAYAPRYAVFHPFKNILYVVNENYPAVSVYRSDNCSGSLIELQLIGTMPEDYYERFPLPDYQKREAAADEVNTSGMGDFNRCMPSDIHVSSDGQYLYVSNRCFASHGSITSFQIKEDGTLEYLFNLPLEGKDPRGFMAAQNGESLIVGLCDQDMIQAFHLRNGIPEKTKADLAVNSPSCLVEAVKGNNI